eukprot:6194003-Pleurochrysis_carterae.AAC.3
MARAAARAAARAVSLLFWSESSALLRMSSLTSLSLLSKTAEWRSELPATSLRSVGTAPRVSSTSHSSTWPLAIATSIGVRPVASEALTEALASSSARATGTECSAARSSSGVPSGVFSSLFAPTYKRETPRSGAGNARGRRKKGAEMTLGGGCT